MTGVTQPTLEWPMCGPFILAAALRTHFNTMAVVPPISAADWVKSMNLDHQATPFAPVQTTKEPSTYRKDPLVGILASISTIESLLGMADLELELCSFDMAEVHARKALEQATTLGDELACMKALVAAKEHLDRDEAAKIAETGLAKANTPEGENLFGIDFYKRWFSERLMRLRHNSNPSTGMSQWQVYGKRPTDRSPTPKKRTRPF